MMDQTPMRLSEPRYGHDACWRRALRCQLQWQQRLRGARARWWPAPCQLRLADCKPILDRSDARNRPCGVLNRIAFVPIVDLPFEDHLVVITDSHSNSFRFDFR